MAYTPLTAPTPSVISPWYAIANVTVITPDGAHEAWGILCEQTQELLVCEDDTNRPWLAKKESCAGAHIRYLNGASAEFPTCTCQE